MLEALRAVTILVSPFIPHLAEKLWVQLASGPALGDQRWSDLAWGGLPAGTVGFVLLPALVPVVLASMVMAPLGARLSHRLPVATLRRIFALVLYGLAAKMALAYA